MNAIETVRLTAGHELLSLIPVQRSRWTTRLSDSRGMCSTSGTSLFLTPQPFLIRR
jgi:hypothetical protein